MLSLHNHNVTLNGEGLVGSNLHQTRALRCCTFPGCEEFVRSKTLDLL